METYSQNNEQEIILKYFAGKRNGAFIDLGANDGVTLSNVFALAKHYDWNGILVEASPKAFKRLQEVYDERYNDLCNVAIGSKIGEIVLHESGELLKQGDTSLISTCIPSEMKRWESLNMPFEPVTVDMVDFKTLISFSKFKQFDMLSIDIEGMEMEVLPQINFNALGIKLAVIEWNGKYLLEYNNLMYRQGFRLLHTNAENLIYAK